MHGVVRQQGQGQGLVEAGGCGSISGLGRLPHLCASTPSSTGLAVPSRGLVPRPGSHHRASGGDCPALWAPHGGLDLLSGRNRDLSLGVVGAEHWGCRVEVFSGNYSSRQLHVAWRGPSWRPAWSGKRGPSQRPLPVRLCTVSACLCCFPVSGFGRLKQEVPLAPGSLWVLGRPGAATCSPPGLRPGCGGRVCPVGTVAPTERESWRAQQVVRQQGQGPRELCQLQSRIWYSAPRA